MAARPRPTSEAVADNVKFLRRLRGMTGLQLADKMAERGRVISRSSIAAMESGQRTISVDDTWLFCEILGSTPNFMLTPHPPEWFNQQVTDALNRQGVRPYGT